MKIVIFFLLISSLAMADNLKYNKKTNRHNIGLTINRTYERGLIYKQWINNKIGFSISLFPVVTDDIEIFSGIKLYKSFIDYKYSRFFFFSSFSNFYQYRESCIVKFPENYDYSQNTICPYIRNYFNLSFGSGVEFRYSVFNIELLLGYSIIKQNNTTKVNNDEALTTDYNTNITFGTSIFYSF